MTSVTLWPCWKQATKASLPSESLAWPLASDPRLGTAPPDLSSPGSVRAAFAARDPLETLRLLVHLGHICFTCQMRQDPGPTPQNVQAAPAIQEGLCSTSPGLCSTAGGFFLYLSLAALVKRQNQNTCRGTELGAGHQDRRSSDTCDSAISTAQPVKALKGSLAGGRFKRSSSAHGSGEAALVARFLKIPAGPSVSESCIWRVWHG